MPSNSKLSLDGWNVNSGFVDAELSGNNYTVSEASTDCGILFVSDQNDSTRLMGLVYPGQTDHTINSSSTVLAMLMKMPVVNSLNSSGQLNLIQVLKDNPLFDEAVLEFETAFLQNKPLFDTTNNAFKSKLRSLFESAAVKNQNENQPHMNIIRVGRNIAVQNPGYAISHYVGIYKDNVKLDYSFMLDPYQFYSGTLAEFLASPGRSPNIIEKIFPLEGDGNFEIKVRTGKPPFDTCFYALGTNISICNDSTEYYKSLIPGNWVDSAYTDYGNDGDYDFVTENKFILFADGTGKRISEMHYSNGFTDYTDPSYPDDPYLHLVWTITPSSNGYTMDYWDQRWGISATGRITPALSYKWVVQGIIGVCSKE